jgi:hypothetical protein
VELPEVEYAVRFTGPELVTELAPSSVVTAELVEFAASVTVPVKPEAMVTCTGSIADPPGKATGKVAPGPSVKGGVTVTVTVDPAV